jgi:spore maturation protein CgeB
LAECGHQVTFFERDVPYYAQHRDLHRWPHGELQLYPSWEQLVPLARERLAHSGAVIITSFCPDANLALDLAETYRQLKKAFYDIDTPFTLHSLAQGESVAYLPPDGLGRYDTVLSFTGGPVI